MNANIGVALFLLFFAGRSSVLMGLEKKVINKYVYLFAAESFGALYFLVAAIGSV